jgi:hypothetical protein
LTPWNGKSTNGKKVFHAQTISKNARAGNAVAKYFIVNYFQKNFPQSVSCGFMGREIESRARVKDGRFQKKNCHKSYKFSTNGELLWLSGKVME